jgi:energy-converting hydrogenase B subunit D
MNSFQLVLFLLVAACGTCVVLTRDPLRQALIFSLYGTIMTILFVVIQAGDVALSELAVGAAATPLMLLVAIASVRTAEKKKK